MNSWLALGAVLAIPLATACRVTLDYAFQEPKAEVDLVPEPPQEA